MTADGEGPGIQGGGEGGTAAAGQPYASWSRVESFLGSGRGVTIPLRPSGGRRVDYVVEEDGGIALHLELGPRRRTPHSPLPLIRIEEIAQEGVRMARLRLTERRLLRDFHDLLNAVAERVIVHDRTPDQAFNETVRAWGALLERPRTLNAEKRLGLLGELIVLNSVASEHGWERAAASWKGPDGEEHDFGLADHDIEVKTTSSEYRRHAIQGLRQLCPSPGRALWLVSVQLTRGGAHGRTLSEAVEAVRARIADEAPGGLQPFDRRLAAAGWSPEQPDDERWSPRTEPLVLPVDDRLPRLDERLLAGLPDTIRPRIQDITYRIDLSDLPPAPEPPTELRAFRIP
ncbi:PD-(D/E)XK motif protein [Streptomyces xinghaiensis]|uniref:PD-(D/E)XK motif protein n=1 Tax=Streptomyces xinghaiensis TaxID=1038928 RepID=UPI003425AB56